MTSWRELGLEVAKQQDDALKDEALVERVREQLRELKLQRPRRARWVGLAAALVFVTGATATWRALRPVTIETPNVYVKTWSQTSSDQTIAFSDGATMLLEPGTRFQVSALSSLGAEIEIERGHASISVPHRRNTQWRLRVGPYLIQVVGTRFDTAWSPQNQMFLLRMIDGVVKLSGPKVDAERQVFAGEVIELDLAPLKPPEPAPLLEPTPVPTKDIETVRPEPLTRGTRAAPLNRSVWRPLAHSGQYLRAWAEAQKEGWQHLCETLVADELVLLGDSARLAQKPIDAGRAYDAVRRRFPSTDSAAAAAFSLGRIAFDDHVDGAAITWFTQYRTERPLGALAPEALGRLIELAQRNGAFEEGRRLARQYEAAYPQGAHSRLAKSLLEQ